MMKRCILIVLFLCSTVLGQATQISTWAGLAGIKDDLTGDYVLTANLDANSTGYSTYAGPTANNNTGWIPLSTFTGTFDGDGHSISDLVIYRNANRQGLFGNNSGTVENLSVLAVSVEVHTGSRQGVGAVAGSNGGTIRNCFATGAVKNSYSGQGGIAGWNDGGTIVACHASVAVTGESGQTGGLVGSAMGGTITDSSASGTVVGGSSVGGFVGYVSTTAGTISGCKATGNVSGVSAVGGFVGQQYVTGSLIENSYASGSVTRLSGSDDDTYIGGFAGRNRTGTLDDCYSTGSVHYADANDPNNKGFCGNNGSTITNCFWDTTTSGQATSSGGTGKTTAQMKTLATFTDAGWDMVAIGDYVDETWYLDAGNDYPRLGWEYEEPAEPLTGGRSQVIIIAKAATPGMVPIGVILLLPVLFGRRREP
jgi:hypothetical protein